MRGWGRVVAAFLVDAVIAGIVWTVGVTIVMRVAYAVLPRPAGTIVAALAFMGSQAALIAWLALNRPGLSIGRRVLRQPAHWRPLG